MDAGVVGDWSVDWRAVVDCEQRRIDALGCRAVPVFESALNAESVVTSRAGERFYL